jgi:hypothetical protein
MTLSAKYNTFERSDLPRVFVPAADGNDAPLNVSIGPQLNYDPPSGNLTLSIPAAVIETGEPGWEFARLYNFSDATFATDLSFGGSLYPTQTAFAWKNQGINGGPLTVAVVGGGEWAFDGWHFAFADAMGFGLGNIVAANFDFGNVLSKDLSLNQLRQTLGIDGMTAGTIDYYGTGGGSVLKVPIGLTIVPEPSAFVEAFIAALVVLSYGRTRRRFARIRTTDLRPW